MEPEVYRAFVRQRWERCAHVMAALEPTAKPLLPSVRMRILDGNKLAARERRLDDLKEVYTLLPGQVLSCKTSPPGCSWTSYLGKTLTPTNAPCSATRRIGGKPTI